LEAIGYELDDAAGPGRGFVDIFSTDGVLLKWLIRHGQLNSPWGLALAPADFGSFSNDLLMGSLGSTPTNIYIFAIFIKCHLLIIIDK
jgi:hypothetical protein